MVGCTRRPRKRVKVRFAEPPWNRRSDEWQVRNQQVSVDHPARAVVEAMKPLDLTPLYNSYSGTGSPPIRPDLMLAVVLIEIREGRPSPSQWFRDTQENIVLQWAGFGIRPSRSVWYDFADRVAPLLEPWNAALLQLAQQQNVTQAERMSLDGTAVAANASRHRLVNKATVEKRLTELDVACQADAGTFGLMLERVANWTGVKPKAALVDAGYVTACNLAICDQAGIVLYGPWQENDFPQKKKKQDAKPHPIGKEHFAWLPEENMYRCPEGHPMPWIGHQKRRQSDGQINVVHSYRCSPRQTITKKQCESQANHRKNNDLKAGLSLNAWPNTAFGGNAHEWA